jgi:DNA-binding NtrC family response regulator
MGKPTKEISPEAAALLVSYRWPGNVRELQNAIERAMVIGREPQIVPADLPLRLEANNSDPQERTLSALEKDHIEGVLREHDGNVTQAARVLGIDRGTLYNKMRKYGIGREA